MMQNISGVLQPYGMAIEIVNQLAWYIGFSVNYYYFDRYIITNRARVSLHICRIYVTYVRTYMQHICNISMYVYVLGVMYEVCTR
jgi:hypothetical protein